jgi:hypothetical protein
MLRLAPMVDAVHRQGAAIFIQLGHGGLFAMEAWHEPYATARAGPILASSPVPWLLRPRISRCTRPCLAHRRGPRTGRPLWRDRGVGSRSGIRRRATRFRERQASRSVLVAVLQPSHRRVRRLPRAAARSCLRSFGSRSASAPAPTIRYR